MIAGTMIQVLHPAVPASDRFSMSRVFPTTGFRQARRVDWRRWRRGAGAGLCLALLVLVVLGCDRGSDPAPPTVEHADVAGPAVSSKAILLESVSDGGHYRIRARPAAMPLKLNRVHDWIIGIERLEGWSEIPTAIRFDGGMPSHGHGFVTRPRVTKNLGGGEFLVEGVKFHMPGEWVLVITVTSKTTTESVTLPLTIAP